MDVGGLVSASRCVEVSLRNSSRSTLGLFLRPVAHTVGVFFVEQDYKSITTFHQCVYLSALVSSLTTP